MDQPAHVPQLRDDPPAGLVDGVGHRLPAVDLASFHRPGAFGQPRPSRLIPVASEMIRPALARCA